ncbi:hypothetical protein VNO77_41638 [Canavalia gladiata]|uniref:Uncharacterized protein n=1 Tax=Canavalia gladiata TaxID=3824 RepID=A0AAN9K1V9_CANGL
MDAPFSVAERERERERVHKAAKGKDHIENTRVGVNVEGSIGTYKVEAMARKRNISIHYDINPLSQTHALLTLTAKKLRRLPHVFSRVLELPFPADADVAVEEAPHCFRFVAETDAVAGVETHTVEIHPGITKIVVRESGSLEFTFDELDLDVWRFRLPESTRPELATAVVVGGELVVTVPKGDDVWGDENNDLPGAATLVLVQ